MNSIIVTTECVADLPSTYLMDNSDIERIYYDVKTEGGLFRDTKEITSQNVLEYMMGGNKVAISIIPSANDYKAFFTDRLKEYDEVLHICISGGISEAFENANLARAKMGREGHKIHIVDSRHLSSGQGLITMEAVRCREMGMKCKDIIVHLNNYIPRVSTSFLAYNADYLYYNHKVSKSVKVICDVFKLHPVLEMVDGKLTVRKVYIGNYEKCASRYIKNLLGKSDMIDKTNGFITYSGCNEEVLEHVHKELDKYIKFDNMFEGPASATVSCNCGPSTFGILFARKESARV